jgi:hypothetical protein
VNLAGTRSSRILVRYWGIYTCIYSHLQAQTKIRGVCSVYGSLLWMLIPNRSASLAIPSFSEEPSTIQRQVVIFRSRVVLWSIVSVPHLPERENRNTFLTLSRIWIREAFASTCHLQTLKSLRLMEMQEVPLMGVSFVFKNCCAVA